jgi:hypothetical protein
VDVRRLVNGFPSGARLKDDGMGKAGRRERSGWSGEHSGNSNERPSGPTDLRDSACENRVPDAPIRRDPQASAEENQPDNEQQPPERPSGAHIEARLRQDMLRHDPFSLLSSFAWLDAHSRPSNALADTVEMNDSAD